MGIGVWDHHTELASTARRWTTARELRAEARRLLEAEDDELPSFWTEMAELGWFGLSVSEACGGQGAGVLEAVVVLEELGAVCAPGPVLSTVLLGAALDRWGADAELTRAVAEGRRVGGFAASSDLRASARDGTVRVEGTCGAVWGGTLADHLLVPVTIGDPVAAEVSGVPVDATAWIVLDRREVDLRALPSFDRTSRLAEAEVDLVAPSGRWLVSDRVDAPLRLAEVLAGAMAVGVAGWCVHTAAEYAKVRVQFGRPIGQFQAVKHRCADMRVDLEAARAAVWDAAAVFDDATEAGWDVAQGAAAALALDAGFRCAEDCIQVLGGIGYTWEHDAHLYLKRATALRSLLPGSNVARARVASAVASGQRRSLSVDLPAEADPARARTREFVEELRRHPTAEWRARLADAGYLAPHWPAPWGMDASPVEQLAIDAELRAAKVRRAHLQIAGWVLPTLIGHGSAEQQERFVRPSLRGDITWCQMFSEPGRG